MSQTNKTAQSTAKAPTSSLESQCSLPENTASLLKTGMNSNKPPNSSMKITAAPSTQSNSSNFCRNWAGYAKCLHTQTDQLVQLVLFFLTSIVTCVCWVDCTLHFNTVAPPEWGAVQRCSPKSSAVDRALSPRSHMHNRGHWLISPA